ncbi:hypothetical protein C0J52_04006 [Blattella germanica]|nr:hypothetical protein C0J52_04006 [Blattella germanica]
MYEHVYNVDLYLQQGDTTVIPSLHTLPPVADSKESLPPVEAPEHTLPRQDGFYRPQPQPSQQHPYYHRPQGGPINKPNENGGIFSSLSNGFNNLVSNIFG